MKQILSHSLTRLRAIDWRFQGGVFAILLFVVVSYQGAAGAYRAEFGAHPDEAAHYVTGLLIRDYLAHGIPRHPMRFAEDYYEHYPKVALGNWPPFFYLVQAGWTLPFGDSRTSVILLMAAITALLATLLFNTLRRHFGLLGGGLGALLLVSLPLVQKFSNLIMTENLLALLSLCAVLCFGKYLDEEKPAWSILFGLFASATILTKGSGLYLAFVPPLAVLLTRRFHFLKRISFWTSAAIVAVLCGPWTFFTLDTAKAGWEQGSPSWAFTSQAFPYYLSKLYLAAGFALALLTLTGLVVAFFRPAAKGRLSGEWAAAGSFFFLVLILQPIVPAGLEPRHLVIALPPMMMFAVTGAASATSWLQARQLKPFSAVAGTVGVTAILFLAETFSVPAKGFHGFSPAAQTLVDDPQYSDAILFVSSDASGEGMFIAEVAMHEKRTGHIVRRSSKLMADSSWSGASYKALLESPDEVLAMLEKEKIGIVVLDNSMREEKREAHHDLLERTVESHPGRFPLILENDAQRHSKTFTDAVRVHAFR